LFIFTWSHLFAEGVWSLFQLAVGVGKTTGKNRFFSQTTRRNMLYRNPVVDFVPTPQFQLKKYKTAKVSTLLCKSLASKTSQLPPPNSQSEALRIFQSRLRAIHETGAP